MKNGEAVKIFKDINSDKITVEEKSLAIKKVVCMETHNSITKKELLNVLTWLLRIESENVCEWHKVKNGNAYKCNTHAEIHDSRVLDWCKCPYCGKKIKVVESEG